ncbi:hypothetical protein Vadar_026856 [Vaccinium darrowii]|uniref:Uncharacterized protein n=1 Tax=Vaccinium darrowii TaxID=229202 RepID=A0ACB7YPR4_9ERIC|nr:hypothetical protein Vadar_026856 [Vaccinium darrowii]
MEEGGPSSSSPNESLARRYGKVVWRTLLISNLVLGAYMFASAYEKKKSAAKVPSTPVSTAATSVPEEPHLYPPITQPVKVREPIPEDQQRELFKWILEEKRKVKPKDREEKKRIDEEKALLKKFIRAKSIPSL